jgi:ribosomal-protein-alanine N-acetyltransferase
MISTTAFAEIALRNYRSSDLEAMFRLDEICFAKDFRFDRESVSAFAEAPNAIVVVAEEAGGEIVGFVIVHVERAASGRHGYVVTLDVAEKRRRMGLAWRLMREAEALVAASDAPSMELHVFTGNQGAIRFYERLGYTRVGVRRRFYGAAGLDAFEYRKQLSHSH